LAKCTSLMKATLRCLVTDMPVMQVRLAVTNTFARCVAQTQLTSKKQKLHSIMESTEANIMDQLDFIAEYYLDLKAISKAWKDQEKEEKRLREAELNNIY